MPLKPALKKQLKISGIIIFIYLIALAIYLKNDIQNAVMGGSDEEASASVPYSELTWEILVVDAELHMKLWSRFDHSPQSEKEKAFLAVIRMLDSMKPDQAEHLAKNFLERSGGAPDPEHRKKLLDMLERLGSKFDSAMGNIARFAAKALAGQLESAQRKKDVRDMMDNIARETKDTGYKYCMKGSESEVKRCAERLIDEGHKNANEHLKNYIQNSAGSEQRADVLVLVAKNQLPFGKEFIAGLLESSNAFEIKTGLRMIREYELTEYRREIEKLRNSKYESVVQEVDQTLVYLATRTPAQKK